MSYTITCDECHQEINRYSLKMFNCCDCGKECCEKCNDLIYCQNCHKWNCKECLKNYKIDIEEEENKTFDNFFCINCGKEIEKKVK